MIIAGLSNKVIVSRERKARREKATGLLGRVSQVERIASEKVLKQKGYCLKNGKKRKSA
jgi:ribosomal protein L20